MDFGDKYLWPIGAILLGIIGIIYALTSDSVIATRLTIMSLIMIGVGIALAWQQRDM